MQFTAILPGQVLLAWPQLLVSHQVGGCPLLGLVSHPVVVRFVTRSYVVCHFGCRVGSRTAAQAAWPALACMQTPGELLQG